MAKTGSIVIARAALLPALASALKIVERRNTIPILSNFRLAAAKGVLSLTATDLDAEYTAAIEGAAGAAAAFTVPAQLLHDAVKKLPDGVEMALTSDGQNMTLAAGRSSFRLPVLPAADFPTMTVGGFSHEFSLPGKTLAAMVAAVEFAISTDETRFYLNGIYWAQSGERLEAAATDGHRLALYPLPLPAGADGMPGVILPRKTVRMLKSILDEKQDAAVAVSDTKIRFAQGQASLVSKLIDGTYPDYRRVVPADNQNRFSVDREELAKAVDRVTTISSERGSAVRFAFGEEDLRLTTANPEAGSAEDALRLDLEQGEPVEIGFNGKYCLDMLAAIESETVTFLLGPAGAAARIEPGGKADGPFYVLMPMRV
ncbi:DNA polymerase III subunit beta [Mesorhizobium sp. CN2-181]|uniref:DNA polymerase III subunit beta n=1 Tax=Mesorhizobium yinganensis TaxID=3157707 RepID=UPI0032B7AA1A